MKSRFHQTSVLTLAAVVMACATQTTIAPVSTRGTWETTLQARDLDGNPDNGPEAFYDTVLDITWLRNANANGRMSWAEANNWANNLVVGGYSDWRLPTVRDVGSDGCNFGYSGSDCGYNVDTMVLTEPHVDSEMAHLYYVTLGNWGLRDTSGKQRPGVQGTNWGLVNTGGFQNLNPQSQVHWTGTPYTRNAGWAWRFGTSAGLQDLSVKSDKWSAMAVRPGDVVAASAPPAEDSDLRYAVGRTARAASGVAQTATFGIPPSTNGVIRALK